MSATSCPIILGDCIGVDSPILGQSSEADDVVYYHASCSPVADAFAPPTLGGGIITQSCAYTEFAGLTQEEADALAAAACGPQVAPTYYSNPVTVTVPCGVGLTATVSLPYGAASSPNNQGEADDLAYSMATQLANEKAAANDCDQVLTGAGGDALIGAGGEPVEPVSW